MRLAQAHHLIHCGHTAPPRRQPTVGGRRLVHPPARPPVGLPAVHCPNTLCRTPVVRPSATRPPYTDIDQPGPTTLLTPWTTGASTDRWTPAVHRGTLVGVWSIPSKLVNPCKPAVNRGLFLMYFVNPCVLGTFRGIVPTWYIYASWDIMDGSARTARTVKHHEE